MTADRGLECSETLVRSQMYALAARTLADPEALAAGAALADLERIALESNVPSVFRAARAVRARMRDRTPSVRALTQEHTELIVKGTVPPYETSFASPALGLSTLADISGFLRAFGLKPKADRVDHVVSELEFLALLCLKEGIAVGRGDESAARTCRDARETFIREHVGRWIGTYHRALTEKVPDSLYTTLADLAREIVEMDASGLGVVPEEFQEVASLDDESLPKCGVAR